MTGSIGFKVTLGTSTNNFVAALYDTSNVGTVLESIPVPKTLGVYPPSFQVTFTYNLLQDSVYRVILWETAGTTPGGISRISDDFKASLNSIMFMAPLYLTADVSVGLVSGTNTYVNSDLIGWDIVLDIPGSGPAYPGGALDYTYDKTTGTITYQLGNWSNGQRVVVYPQPQISAAPQPPISAISSGRIITVSEVLTSASKNKALWIQAAGSNITVTLPDISTVADYDHIVLYSAGGNHINAVIPTFGTDKIQLNNQVTKIILGQAEKLDLVKANGVWNVDYLSPTYWMVGEYIYKPSKGEVNTIFADGCISGLLLRADHPRIYDYLDNRLDPAAIIAEASWANTSIVDGTTFFPNMGKWTRGNGTTTFRVPRLYDSGFLRGVDGSTRFPGSQQTDALLDCQVDSLIGLVTGAPNGRGPVKPHSGSYGGATSSQTDLSSRPGKLIGGVFTILTRLDTNETRPVNTGAYISIRS